MPSAPPPSPAPWWQRAWDAAGPGPEPAPLTKWQNTWRLVLAAVIGYGSWVAVTWPWGQTYSTARWALVAIDAVVGIGCLWLYQRRRKHPVAIAVILTALTAVFATVTGASLLAFVSLAARRHLRGIILVLPISVAAALVTERIVWASEPPPFSIWNSILSQTLLALAIAAVAYAIGARRAVRESAIQRAEATEREQAARIAQARAAERTRIAREMHDVLAHRISLVAMHASALNYRSDLSDEERRTAAATIERNAREALTELREVLGVLRDPASVGGEEVRPEAPQPTLGDLESLVAEARTLGSVVTLSDESGEVPERVGRAAYRIVQEALTNARKHAPGAPVTVELSAADGVLEVRMSQPMHTNPVVTAPGSGLGLIGLRERVDLVGGSLDAGPDGSGRWVVNARLPLHHE